MRSRCDEKPDPPYGTAAKLLESFEFSDKHSVVQADAINRRVGEVPGNPRFVPSPSEEGKSPTAARESVINVNWILDPPEPLVAAQDFHFAISASFRMTQSMGDEFIFDEVR